MTDIASGNLPNVRSVGDAFKYAAESAGNALDVAGSGKLAKAGIAGLKKLGLDLMPDVAERVAETVAEQFVTGGLEFVAAKTPLASEVFLTTTIGEITIGASKSFLPQLALGSLATNPLRGAVLGQLGVAEHGHHSYPKYLGGDPGQQLTRMPASDHKQLHKDMNDFMRQQTDANGNHMRLQRGNSGKDIRRNFKTQEMEGALKRFYSGPGAKYKNAAMDFFKQVSKIR